MDYRRQGPFSTSQTPDIQLVSPHYYNYSAIAKKLRAAHPLPYQAEQAQGKPNMLMFRKSMLLVSVIQESYRDLRLRSQPTRPTPILPSRIAPGAGIVLTSILCHSVRGLFKVYRFITRTFPRVPLLLSSASLRNVNAKPVNRVVSSSSMNQIAS